MDQDRRQSYRAVDRQFHEIDRADDEIYNGASRQEITLDESDYENTRRSEVGIDETGWKHTTRGVVHRHTAQPHPDGEASPAEAPEP